MFGTKQGQDPLIHAPPNEGIRFEDSKLPCPIGAESAEVSIASFGFICRTGEVTMLEGQSGVVESRPGIAAAGARQHGHKNEQ